MTPENYSTVCPYLMVDNIGVQIDFMQHVFGATIKENMKNGDGITMHCEVVIGETVIMMGKGSKEFPSQPGMNYVYVASVAEVYSKAMAAGAVSLFTPAERFYGVIESGFKDMHGNVWFASQHVKDVPVAEMEQAFAQIKK